MTRRMTGSLAHAHRHSSPRVGRSPARATAFDRRHGIAVALILVIVGATLCGCATPHADRGDGGKANAELERENRDTAADLDLPGGGRDASEAVTRGAHVQTGMVPLGAVPYDEFTLPLLRPGGTHVATQVGIPPRWSTALAQLDAPLPEATSIEIRAIAPGEPSRVVHRLPNGILLGRSADDRGFLVEQPLDDGSRRIGVCSWDSATIAWLIDDGKVNAHATWGPFGELVWSRRGVNAPRFDLAIRGERASRNLAAEDGESWMFPEMSRDGELIFALRLRDGVLQAAALRGANAAALRQSMRTITLTNRGTPLVAYQTVAPRLGAGPDPHAPRDAWMFFHPGEGRVSLWRPSEGRVRGFRSGSISAAMLDPERALLSLPHALVVERLADGDISPPLLDGSHVIRSVSDQPWSYVLMSPGEGSVGLIGLTVTEERGTVGE